MNQQERKNLLQETLAGLLGFDDGASDVLEHLLTIESRKVKNYHIPIPDVERRVVVGTG